MAITEGSRTEGHSGAKVLIRGVSFIWPYNTAKKELANLRGKVLVQHDALKLRDVASAGFFKKEVVICVRETLLDSTSPPIVVA